MPAGMGPGCLAVVKGSHVSSRVAGLWIASILVLGLDLLAPGCASGPKTVFREPTVVEAACGECLFGLPGKGCDLAIRWNGRAHFVDGVELDALGDAHAADGLCKTVRQARVTGEFRKGRFRATTFELLPATAAGAH